MHGAQSAGARHRKREARLTRQADVQADDFEHFRALATGRFRRLSASKPSYGGSLPSFCVDDSFTEMEGDCANMNEGVSAQAPDTLSLACNGGQLSMPLSPLAQRASSFSNDSTFEPAHHLPRSPTRYSPARFFTTVKSKLEQCDKKTSALKSNSQGSGNSSLDVPSVPKCPSAPHSRSNSFKRKRGRSASRQEDKAMQERTSSMPIICKQNSHRRPSHLPLSAMRLHPNSCESTTTTAEEWQRVRNFMTSPKGIINCGDSFRRSQSSLRSADSWGSDDWGWSRSTEGRPVPQHRVLILGGPGVGKTTLAQQFITSDCLVNVELIGEYEDCLSVSVLLDEEEAKVDILEIPFNQDHGHMSEVDAYIVVYANNDRDSFHHAVDLLYRLCKEDFVQSPVILVANKTDLVRAREVAEQEGKSAAVTYTCKYFEVSSLMNLKVDELLAGILNQIRLRKLTEHRKSEVSICAHDCAVKSPMRIIGRVLRPGMLRRQQSKSCDNLLVL